MTLPVEEVAYIVGNTWCVGGLDTQQNDDMVESLMDTLDSAEMDREADSIRYTMESLFVPMGKLPPDLNMHNSQQLDVLDVDQDDDAHAEISCGTIHERAEMESNMWQWNDMLHF